MASLWDWCADSGLVTLPPTLRLTILRRISFLADGALQALRFASVLGTGFTLTDLAEVTGRSAVDLSMSWPSRSGPGCSRTTGPGSGSATT